MNIILNTAAGIFCLLIPATLLASSWNVLAPAAWCWLERGTAAVVGAIATGLLFLFARSYREAEKKSSQNTPKNAPAISDGKSPYRPRKGSAKCRRTRAAGNLESHHENNHPERPATHGYPW